MSNDLPAGYHASARNYIHSKLTGNTHDTAALSSSAIKPTSFATAIGHAVARGKNSPSQLTHTFGK